jgi:hypothetical protein
MCDMIRAFMAAGSGGPRGGLGGDVADIFGFPVLASRYVPRTENWLERDARRDVVVDERREGKQLNPKSCEIGVEVPPRIHKKKTDGRASTSHSRNDLYEYYLER